MSQVTHYRVPVLGTFVGLVQHKSFPNGQVWIWNRTFTFLDILAVDFAVFENCFYGLGPALFFKLFP